MSAQDPARLSEIEWASMPEHGEINFDQLVQAVSEAIYADRSFNVGIDKDRFVGHQMVPAFNFNSLNRIVSAFVRAARVTSPDAHASIKVEGHVLASRYQMYQAGEQHFLVVHRDPDNTLHTDGGKPETCVVVVSSAGSSEPPLQREEAHSAEDFLTENKKLRQIVSECASAAGAGVAPNCSMEFLALVPGEISAVLSRTRRDAFNGAIEAINQAIIPGNIASGATGQKAISAVQTLKDQKP